MKTTKSCFISQSLIVSVVRLRIILIRTNQCLTICYRWKRIVRLRKCWFWWNLVQIDHKDSENKKSQWKVFLWAPRPLFEAKNTFKICQRTEKQAHSLTGWLMSLFQNKLACFNKELKNIIISKTTNANKLSISGLDLQIAHEQFKRHASKTSRDQREQEKRIFKKNGFSAKNFMTLQCHLSSKIRKSDLS